MGSVSQQSESRASRGPERMSHAGKRAVVLLSGGLDSATALAEAKMAGFEVYALTLLYGQRHDVEQSLDLRAFGGSALTADIAVPKGRGEAEMGKGIPVTYVPARNTVFLSIALAWAESLGAFDIYVGVNCVDYSGYPDCRPEYLRAFETLANLATKAGVEGAGRFRVHAPLLTLTKDQVVLRGRELGVDFGLTHSCYDPTTEGLACGQCDACTLRLTAFARLGLRDPIMYGCGNGPP